MKSVLCRVALSLALIALMHADGDSETRVRRIGFVGFQGPGLEWSILAAFQARLRELGWVEDRNVVTSYRWADGRAVNYPRIIRELVQSDVDIMVIPCGAPLQIVRKLNPTVPAVVRCLDFSEFGREIETPGRPGGYTTGVTYFSPRCGCSSCETSSRDSRASDCSCGLDPTGQRTWPLSRPTLGASASRLPSWSGARRGSCAGRSTGRSSARSARS